MSKTHRIKLRHRLLGGLYELIWLIRGPKWCRMPERSSLSMSVSEMRKAGLL